MSQRNPSNDSTNPRPVSQSSSSTSTSSHLQNFSAGISKAFAIPLLDSPPDSPRLSTTKGFPNPDATMPDAERGNITPDSRPEPRKRPISFMISGSPRWTWVNALILAISLVAIGCSIVAIVLSVVPHGSREIVDAAVGSSMVEELSTVASTAVASESASHSSKKARSETPPTTTMSSLSTESPPPPPPPPTPAPPAPTTSPEPSPTESPDQASIPSTTLPPPPPPAPPPNPGALGDINGNPNPRPPLTPPPLPITALELPPTSSPPWTSFAVTNTLITSGQFWSFPATTHAAFALASGRTCACSQSGLAGGEGGSHGGRSELSFGNATAVRTAASRWVG